MFIISIYLKCDFIVVLYLEHLNNFKNAKLDHLRGLPFQLSTRSCDCSHTEEVLNVSLLVSTQQKHMELERTTKWVKMLKSWDKYKNSEKVTDLR